MQVTSVIAAGRLLKFRTTNKAVQTATMSNALQKAWDELDGYLNNVSQACMPRPSDIAARSSLIVNLNRVIQSCSWLHNAQIKPYGSFLSGMYNCNSDMDVALEGQVSFKWCDALCQKKIEQDSGGVPPEMVSLTQLDKFGKGQALKKFLNKVLDFRLAIPDTVQRILHARVPIIKFRDARTGVECDLGIGGDGQVLKATMLRLLTQINPMFMPLYNVVKQFAKAHGINDGTIGLFNSHCLALLVVFYLQSCPDKMLPPLWRLFHSSKPAVDAPRLLETLDVLSEAEAIAIATGRADFARQEYGGRGNKSLAELFLGFVHFYHQLFGIVLKEQKTDLRISTWFGELQTGAPMGTYAFVVEEPLNATDNPARTFGNQADFPWTLHYVWDVLDRTKMVLSSIAEGNHLPEVALAYMFGPCALIYPPLNTCLAPAFGAWPEWVKGCLARDKSNAAQVLYDMLITFQAPADIWVPPHVLCGPTKWKEYLIGEARNQHKEARGRKTHEQHHGIADSLSVQAEPLVPPVATGKQLVAELDDQHMLTAALGLAGTQAALKAAAILYSRKKAREAQQAARKDEKKAAAIALAKELSATAQSAVATANLLAKEAAESEEMLEGYAGLFDGADEHPSEQLLPSTQAEQLLDGQPQHHTSNAQLQHTRALHDGTRNRRHRQSQYTRLSPSQQQQPGAPSLYQPSIHAAQQQSSIDQAMAGLSVTSSELHQVPFRLQDTNPISNQMLARPTKSDGQTTHQAYQGRGSRSRGRGSRRAYSYRNDPAV